MATEHVAHSSSLDDSEGSGIGTPSFGQITLTNGSGILTKGCGDVVLWSLVWHRMILGRTISSVSRSEYVWDGNTGKGCLIVLTIPQSYVEDALECSERVETPSGLGGTRSVGGSLWGRAFRDECHQEKNEARTYEILRSLRGGTRLWVLSGTPFEISPADLARYVECLSCFLFIRLRRDRLSLFIDAWQNKTASSCQYQRVVGKGCDQYMLYGLLALDDEDEQNCTIILTGIHCYIRAWRKNLKAQREVNQGRP